MASSTELSPGGALQGVVDDRWLQGLEETSRLQAATALGRGRELEAVFHLREALLLKPGEEAAGALRSGVALLSNLRLAKLWAAMITAGETPAALSSRDGRLLRRLQDGSRLTPAALVQRLQDAFVGIEPEVRAALCGVYEAHAHEPSVRSHARHLLLAFRGAALLMDKNLAQAMRDANASLAFMPSGGCAVTLAMHGFVLEAAARVSHDGGVSEIRVGSIDIAVPLSTAAAISLARAIHLSPASALWSASLLRITACLPELHRTLLIDHGPDMLLRRLQLENELQLPAFKVKEPKFSAYYRWTTRRIRDRFPGLAEEAEDQLLSMDSGQLDMVLSTPNMDIATMLQAARGELSWARLQAIAAENKPALQ